MGMLFHKLLLYINYKIPISRYLLPKKKLIEPQGIERGRTLTRISSISKYGGGAQAGANFRGRKSNSLMNLCGGKKV